MFGLAEEDWWGSEQCETYQKYKNKSGLDIYKEILGVQESINIWVLTVNKKGLKAKEN